jgi:hypothetical protein
LRVARQHPEKKDKSLRNLFRYTVCAGEESYAINADSKIKLKKYRA